MTKQNDQTESKSKEEAYMSILKYREMFPLIGLLISFGAALLKHGVPKESIVDVLLNPFHPFIVTAGMSMFLMVIIYMFFLKMAIIDCGKK